jgi:hypothetical protein
VTIQHLKDGPRWRTFGFLVHAETDKKASEGGFVLAIEWR